MALYCPASAPHLGLSCHASDGPVCHCRALLAAPLIEKTQQQAGKCGQQGVVVADLSPPARTLALCIHLFAYRLFQQFGRPFVTLLGSLLAFVLAGMLGHACAKKQSAVGRQQTATLTGTERVERTNSRGLQASLSELELPRATTEHLCVVVLVCVGWRRTPKSVAPAVGLPCTSDPAFSPVLHSYCTSLCEQGQCPCSLPLQLC